LKQEKAMLSKKERIDIYRRWIELEKTSSGFVRIEWLQDDRYRMYPVLMKYDFHEGFKIIESMPPWEECG